MAGGRARGYGRRWAAVTLAQGCSIGQGKQERCFLTGAASAGHLRPSCIAGSFVSCPAPCSSPPGGLSSAPRWLQRATTGDGGIRLCQLRHIWGNHARELAELLLLQAPRPVFADSPSFPSALRASPTFSMPQDHPDGPNAAENNTVQCGSSPPPLPALPAYKKALAPSHPSTGARTHFPQHLYPPPPRTQTDPCSTGPRSTRLMLRGTSASHQ